MSQYLDQMESFGLDVSEERKIQEKEDKLNQKALEIVQNSFIGLSYEDADYILSEMRDILRSSAVVK